MDSRMLFYDADCPLCVWYTGAFVKWGWMKPEERVAWDQMPESASAVVDEVRSRHEIALFDPRTNQVWYGIDSLLAIMGRRFPIIGRIGHLPVVHHGLRLLYQVITYNRKIIAGKSAEDCKGSCNPDFHAGWRLTYVTLAFIAAITLLAGWFPVLERESFAWGWALAMAIFVATPVLLMLRLPRRRAWDVAGHAATVGLVVGILLTPLRIIFALLESGQGLALGCAVAGGLLGGLLLLRRIRGILIS